MPSLVPNFEYDIFISYRHNDNLDGWVTDFVQNLEKELRGTLKDAVTIYFDKNLHDGLLETHSVDKSLEGKLKCLIFISIISQTYCDPKSFAWQHEFCAFNRLAKDDSFGRDIKLTNGNVASRILPIKIHDLDAEDKTTIENEMGGVLRAIEFIYKEAGVNRPLKATDDRSLNQNRTDYRNQVNKVANAVKEIIQTMKSPVSKATIHGNRESSQGNGVKKNTRKRVAGIALGLMILLALVYGVSQYMSGPRSETEALDKSIAVLPFVDMSQNKDQEYLGDGIAEEILNVLAKVKDIKVIGRTSSFAYKGKAIDLKTIGRELGVSTILEGSIRKDGNRIRVTAQFIRAEDGFHLWSESYDRDLKDIFQIQDDLAKSITRSLLSSFNTSTIQPSTGKDQINDKAYELYLLGKYYVSKRGMDNFYKAIDLFDQSLALDDQFVEAYATLAEAYSEVGFSSGNQEIKDVWALAERNAKRALELDGNNSLALSQMGTIQRNYYWNWEEARTYYQRAIASAPNNGDAHRSYSMLLSVLVEKDSALYHARKALEFNPTSVKYKTTLARVLYYFRDYRAAFDQIESIAETTGESQFFRLMILIQLDKDKALANILESSRIDKTVQGELQTIYRKDGWEAVMKEIVASYLPQITQSETIMLSLVSSNEARLKRTAENMDSKTGSSVYLLVDPSSDPLRSEPQYEALLKRMGLDKYKKE